MPELEEEDSEILKLSGELVSHLGVVCFKLHAAESELVSLDISYLGEKALGRAELLWVECFVFKDIVLLF